MKITTLFYLATIPIGYIWKGFVFSILWRWFIVPFGAPEISIPVAIGIGVIVSLMTRSANTDDLTDKEYLAISLYALIAPLLSLLVGWIVSMFI